MSRFKNKILNKLWNGVLVPLVISATWYIGHTLSDVFEHVQWVHLAAALTCGFLSAFLACKLWRK